jgi:hypothetical protein
MSFFIARLDGLGLPVEWALELEGERVDPA